MAPTINGTKYPASAAVWTTAFLKAIPTGKTELELRKGERLYAQGDKAAAIFFILEGKIKLSVLSKTGSEAILGILTAGEFCGEACLSGQDLRVGSATAMTSALAMRIAKTTMTKALHDQRPLSAAFLVQLLARNIAFEEDICDQLFNHSEKRLARTLLKLSGFGRDAHPAHTHVISPGVSQEALAGMIGTTRSRVNHFMNKFRRLGLIEYNGEIHVRPELLTDVVLND